MSSNSYTLEVIGDVSKYAEAMGRIPGITDEAVAKATLKFQAQLLKQHNAAAKAAKDLEAKIKDGGFKGLADGADEASAAAAKLRGSLSTLSPTAGAVAGLVNDFGDALTILASPAGIAAGVIGGLALASTAATSALVGAVFASDEALESLKGFKRIGSDFYPAVPRETLESIEAVNASTTALKSIWDKAVVTVGVSVAPALEQVANVAVGAALGIADLARYFDVALAAGGLFARQMVSQVATGLSVVLTPLEATIRGMVALSDQAGIAVPDAVRSAATTISNLTAKTTAAAAGFLDGAVSGTTLEGVLKRLGERGETFIATQIRATKAVKDTGKAAEEAAKQLEQLYLNQFLEIDRNRKAEEAAANRQLIAANNLAQAKLDFIAAGNAANEKAADEQIAKMRKVEAARAALSDSLTAANQRDQDAIVGAFDSSLGAISSLAGEAASKTAESNAEVSKRWFAFSQASAISQALINGALAVTKSFAELGPIAGAVAAGAVGITTGAQIAQIAAQDPPSFHVGGVISGVRDLAPDETYVRARRGEGFLTPRGVEAAGGSQGIRAMNQGRGQAGTSVSVTLSVTGRTAQRIAQVGAEQPVRGGRPATGQRPRKG